MMNEIEKFSDEQAKEILERRVGALSLIDRTTDEKIRVADPADK
jgi:hypothetical protein